MFAVSFPDEFLFSYQAKRLVLGNVSKMTYLVSSRTQNHNPVNQTPNGRKFVTIVREFITFGLKIRKKKFSNFNKFLKFVKL